MFFTLLWLRLVRWGAFFPASAEPERRTAAHAGHEQQRPGRDRPQHRAAHKAGQPAPAALRRLHELRAKTDEFRTRYQNGETLDQLLPEAFATCREAAWRVLGMRHYRVQVIGGIVLHQGRIAEMKTGEGKTLVATLPAYLNAIAGKGVHIVTVNDYLAKRDSE